MPACDTIPFPQCLTATSRAVGGRKLPHCHLLMLQAKHRPQVLLLLASQTLQSPCQPMNGHSWTLAVASVKALHLGPENLVPKHLAFLWTFPGYQGLQILSSTVLGSFISFLFSLPLCLYFCIPSFCPLSNQIHLLLQLLVAGRLQSLLLSGQHLAAEVHAVFRNSVLGSRTRRQPLGVPQRLPELL